MVGAETDDEAMGADNTEDSSTRAEAGLGRAYEGACVDAVALGSAEA